tara:strand:- start:897 stop:1001 length:105 start_codon:yes stop_codon:yes gene_type:complete
MKLIVRTIVIKPKPKGDKIMDKLKRNYFSKIIWI